MKDKNRIPKTKLQKTQYAERLQSKAGDQSRK